MKDLVTPLSPVQIEIALEQLPDWVAMNKTIVKRYTFRTFPDALMFVMRVGFEAEAADHHPDLTVNFRRVTVAYWTHTAGGVTQKDLDGAAVTDRVAATMAGARTA